MKNLRTGQSLIEILIAISVMVLVLITLLSLTVTSLSSTSSARITSEATNFSQTIMEQIRNNYLSSSWDQFLTNCSDNFSNIDLDQDQSNFFDSPIISCTDTEREGEKKVTVIISWTDSKGPHKSQLEDIFISRSQ